jgi:hypothetical protein
VDCVPGTTEATQHPRHRLSAALLAAATIRSAASGIRRNSGGDNADIEQVASSKQLPTNQRDTDNAEKHEPNKIHPEDYGVCVAHD